jgi:hypothetical protein
MIFSKNSAGPVGKALIVMIDLVALAAQATVFFVVMGTQYTAFIEKAMYVSTPAPSLNDPKPVDMLDPFANAAEASRQLGDPIGGGGVGGGSTSTDFGAGSPVEKPKWKGSWETPFALLFTSIIWWENYVDRDIKLGFINMPLATYKRHLQSVRSKANIGASLWKIALTITFSVIMLPSKRFENAFVKMPTLPDAPMTTMAPPPGMNGPGGGGDQMIDFGGLDSLDNGMGIGAARKINRRDAASTTTIAMISSAMNLDAMLTVPNNAWGNSLTTPNLFDFIAAKVFSF